MRSLQQIRDDIASACRIDDAARLLSLADEALDLHTQEATSVAFQAQGWSHRLTSDYPSSVQCYERAYAIADSLGDTADKAACLNGLGNTYQVMGNTAAAMVQFRNALGLFQLLDDRAGAARVAGNIGNVYLLMGDLQQALDSYRSAQELHEEFGNRAGVASMIGNIGLVHARMTDYPTALEHYTRALNLHTELGNRMNAATVAGNIGHVYASIGHHQQALEYFRHALTQHEHLGNRLGIATVIGNLGYTHLMLGDYALAMECYLRSVQIYEELELRSGLAFNTGFIGVVHWKIGDYPTALEYFARALVIHEELSDRAEIARIIWHIGSVHADIGDFNAALACFESALAVQQELGFHHSAASVIGSIGDVYQGTGDHERALEQYQRAIALHTDLGDQSGVALFTGCAITSLIDLHRVDDAVMMLEYQATMPMTDPEVRTRHHGNLARVAESQHDLDGAARQLRLALDIALDAGLAALTTSYHERLRDLALVRNDLPGYVEHNTQFLIRSEELRSRETAQKLATLRAERTFQAERKERDKERVLLYGALPRAIADRLVRGEQVTGDQYDGAVILFMDIVDFSIHTSAMHPTMVVSLLGDVFAAIDATCNEHGVTKIKTIGDSYMCFRGDADAETNALSVANVAMEVMKGAFTWPDGSRILFRAGMHIGPATAGVIGTQRLQYDVWGDTVNVASRLENTGEPGRIHVSADMALALRHAERRESGHRVVTSPSHSLVLTLRGDIELKGKGTMTTYWLEGPPR